MNNVDPRRARWIKFRMGVLCALLGVGLSSVVSSAFNIQVKHGAEWRMIAERQRQRKLKVNPTRGSILDRNGEALAVSVDVPSVAVNAHEMVRGLAEPKASLLLDANAAKLAGALGLSFPEVQQKLRSRRRFAWLKRRISESEVHALRKLSDKAQRYPIAGLQIEGEGRRFYPNRELAGPLLGFVSPDGDGREGLELSLEHELKGHVSEVHGLRDRSGRLLFSEGMEDEQALAGHNVYLTIDKGIQFTAERELNAAMKTYEALGGAVVVVEPRTGEVLALASTPGYNPNDYNTADPDTRRNRAIVDRFEPGSVMKVFAVAAALAAKSVAPDASIYCEGGTMAIDNVVIHDTHVSKWLTVTQILSISSNIGAAKIALGLGESRLYEGLRRFGFGDLTGVPFPGEAMGVLRPHGNPWVQVETATAAYGQGISVTTLQLAMAMAAVANNGRLLEPILVKRVADGSNVTLSEATPRVRRDVVPAHVAQMMSEMLVSVTEGEGTGVEAAIPGFKVAGKTATAQKIDPATHRYSDTHYVASFVGFVPADRPRLAIAVVLDEPLGGTHAGGSVAGPVFRRIGESALRYLGVTPRGTVPMKLSEVSERAKDADVAVNAYKAMAAGKEPAPVAPPTSYAPARAGEAKVPDLAGWPLREAVKTAIGVGLVPAVEGSGRLSKQDPPAGSVLPKGSTIKLIFEPST